jgi:hypothetical protein
MAETCFAPFALLRPFSFVLAGSAFLPKPAFCVASDAPVHAIRLGLASASYARLFAHQCLPHLFRALSPSHAGSPVAVALLIYLFEKFPNHFSISDRIPAYNGNAVTLID